MKKILLSLVLVILAGTAMSQNVIGDPVYYTDSTQYRPGHGMGYNQPSYHPYRQNQPQRLHHVRNTDVNRWFVETKMMLGELDGALGVDVAFVPEKWGVYGSSLWGNRYDWISCGGIYRITEPGRSRDWQLYGGLVFGPTMGSELGIRVAFDNFGANGFSWWSASLGMANVAGYGFINVGLSIGLSGAGLLEILL